MNHVLSASSLKWEAPTKYSEAWLLRGSIQARADTQAQHRRQEHKQTGLGTRLSGSEDSSEEQAHGRGVSLGSQEHDAGPRYIGKRARRSYVSVAGLEEGETGQGRAGGCIPSNPRPYHTSHGSQVGRSTHSRPQSTDRQTYEHTQGLVSSTVGAQNGLLPASSWACPPHLPRIPQPGQTMSRGECGGPTG